MSDIGDPGTGSENRASPSAGSVPAAMDVTPPMDVTHRRNLLAGLWAAELLGLIGHAAQDYVRGVLHPGHPQEQIHGDDHEDVVDKLIKDLAGRVSVHEIRERMAHFLREARRQHDDKKSG